MVFKLFVIGCAMIASSVTTAAVQTNFSAKVSDNSVELGKYITLQLNAPASMPPLNTVDLSSLKTRFHIDSRNDIVTETGRQNWKLRLYPYQKGEQRIPALELNKFKTTSIMISVTDAIDPKSKSPLTIQYSTSSTTPWLREQVLMIYTLSSTQKLYDLKLTDATHPVASIYTLDTEEAEQNPKLSHAPNQDQNKTQTTAESTVNAENHRTYSYKTGYAIFSLKAGKHQISLPPLILKRDGTTTHHFYPPPINLSVKALPLYLPATVPVGAINLETETLYWFKLTQRLTNANLHLSGKRVLPSTLPDIAHQLNSTDSIQTYPESHKKQQIINSSGLNTNIHYSLPLKLVTQGIHSFAPIRILNFDPTKGTLRSTQYNMPRIISLNVWVSILLSLLISLAVLYLLMKLYRYIIFQFRRQRCYKLALQTLSNSNEPHSIRTALKLISQAEGKNQNQTPQAWLKIFASGTTNNELLDPLNQVFYNHKNEQDISTLTHMLIVTIENRRPLFF